jgi:hypothetical protein
MTLSETKSPRNAKLIPAAAANGGRKDPPIVNPEREDVQRRFGAAALTGSEPRQPVGMG